MTKFHVYEPRDGHGLAHDPFNSIVAPRPIGWISSISADGVENLAPYSFFNAFNYIPPIIGFSSIGWKDSVRNIEATGEFAWNLATQPLAEAMNTTSAPAAAGMSEFSLAGLTPTASRRISAPRVLESPVSFECRVCQIVRLTNSEGIALESWLVLGEVAVVHIAKELIEEGIYDTVKAAPIVRGGGPSDFFTIGEAQRFHMKRPRINVG